MGIFRFAQGQLTPQKSNSIKTFWLSLLPEKMKKIQSKMGAVVKSGHNVLFIITLWKLSVAMETRVPNLTGPKPIAAFPPAIDALDKIWLNSACRLRRYSCLKVLTDRQTNRLTNRLIDDGSTGILNV